MENHWNRNGVKITTLLLIMLLFTPLFCRCEEPAQYTWFQDAKFGLFIHWGVYSLMGKGEWVMNNDKITVADYEKLYPQFNPEKFNADEWVSMVKDAGIRYITITSKHHDGFCMFDSKLTDYTILHTPFHRDVMEELAEACHKQGIKLFFYYSQLDWHHPDYFPRGRTGQNTGRPESGDWNKYVDYYIGQVSELCTHYGPIGGLWFDGWWDKPDADWQMDRLYKTIHTLQPEAMIGNNHHHAPFPGEDFQMFEQDLPGENSAGFNQTGISSLPLETCLTMNGAWGYNKDDHHYKSVKEILGYLVRAAGYGANLLLNVGPQPTGEIQPEFKERLAEIGVWLRENGEAIYGTRRGPVVNPEWGTTVRKGDDTVYVHILKYPGRFIQLNAPNLLVRSARLLHGPEIEFSNRPEGPRFVIPKEQVNDLDTILELKAVQISPDETPTKPEE